TVSSEQSRVRRFRRKNYRKNCLAGTQRRIQICYGAIGLAAGTTGIDRHFKKKGAVKIDAIESCLGSEHNIDQPAIDRDAMVLGSPDQICGVDGVIINLESD